MNYGNVTSLGKATLPLGLWLLGRVGMGHGMNLITFCLFSGANTPNPWAPEGVWQGRREGERSLSLFGSNVGLAILVRTLSTIRGSAQCTVRKKYLLLKFMRFFNSPSHLRRLPSFPPCAFMCLPGYHWPFRERSQLLSFLLIKNLFGLPCNMRLPQHCFLPPFQDTWFIDFPWSHFWRKGICLGAWRHRMTHLQRVPQSCLKVSEAGLELATIVKYMLYKILSTSLVPKLYIFCFSSGGYKLWRHIKS